MGNTSTIDSTIVLQYIYKAVYNYRGVRAAIWLFCRSRFIAGTLDARSPSAGDPSRSPATKASAASAPAPGGKTKSKDKAKKGGKPKAKLVK